MTNSDHHFVADQYLVNRALSGEMNAFGDIIRLTEKLTADICSKMIKNPEDRKDIAQDIYLKVWKSLPEFRFQSRLTTWVAQIGYNTCINYLNLKKLPRAGELIENIMDEENSHTSMFFGPVSEAELFIFRSQTKEIIATAIDSLQPVYRTVISLFHHHDLSYEEIAVITSLPVGTVKSHLYRARKKLKDYLLTHYKRDEL